MQKLVIAAGLEEYTWGSPGEGLLTQAVISVKQMLEHWSPFPSSDCTLVPITGSPPILPSSPGSGSRYFRFICVHI